MTGEWTNRFPNLVRLRRGDVVQVFGRRQVVVLVSDCCARVIKEQAPGKRHVVTRFGAEFDVRESDDIEKIATYEPPEVVLERHGAAWLETFLATRRGAVNNNNGDTTMPRNRTQDRGGLARDAVATDAPKLRRGRKPKGEGNGTPATPRLPKPPRAKSFEGISDFIKELSVPGCDPEAVLATVAAKYPGCGPAWVRTRVAKCAAAAKKEEKAEAKAEEAKK